jgi:hypothetical protein
LWCTVIKQVSCYIYQMCSEGEVCESKHF